MVAATVANLDALNDQSAANLAEVGLYTATKALARGTPVEAVDFSALDDIPSSEAPMVANLIQTTATWTMWETRRVVYAVHPQLAGELAAVNWDTLPAGIIDRLPHDNPLTVFAEPVTCTAPGGGDAVALGFLLTGVDTVSNRYCDVHDPARTHLYWSLYLDQPDTVSVVALSMPTTAGSTLRVDDVAARAATNMRVADLGDPDRKFGRTPAQIQQALTPMIPIMRLAVASTVYLCSREPDTAVAATGIRRRVRTRGEVVGTRRREKPATVVEVGWRLGPPLPSPRRVTTETGEHTTASEQSASGAQKAPHSRRAHPHLYWTGPGRTIPVVKRIARIDVNAHLGAPKAATIVPVRSTHPSATGDPTTDMHDALAAASAPHQHKSAVAGRPVPMTSGVATDRPTADLEQSTANLAAGAEAS